MAEHKLREDMERSALVEDADNSCVRRSGHRAEHAGFINQSWSGSTRAPQHGGLRGLGRVLPRVGHAPDLAGLTIFKCMHGIGLAGVRAIS